ncbi:110 kDa antigen-like [Parasteatoda tepidariorum]|uniref:110 kDa antigen-like n=1 Tax=Parasteatoda tepidariorum TaxID=114398 RepID=UPI0039BCAF81
MSSYHRFGRGGKRMFSKPPPKLDHDEIKRSCYIYADRRASSENIDDLISSATTNKENFLDQFNKTGDDDYYENLIRMSYTLDRYLIIKEELTAKETTMPEIVEKTNATIETETSQQTEPPMTPVEQMEIQVPDSESTPSILPEEQHQSSMEMETTETPANTEKKKKKKKIKTCVNSAMQVDPESDGETNSPDPVIAPATPADPAPVEKEEEAEASTTVDPPTPITSSSDSLSSRKLKTLIIGLDIHTDSQELEKYLTSFGLLPEKIVQLKRRSGQELRPPPLFLVIQ